MAINTYEVIATATVDGSTPTISVTVPSGYKNLRLVANLRSGDSRSGYQSVSYRFNNDSSSSYSGTILYGNGSTAASYRQTATVIEGLTVMNGTSGGSYFYTNILNIMSPTNGTTFTPVLVEMGNAGLGSYKQAASWRKTDVVTSIQIIEASNINWVAGSNVTLYGIGSGTGGDVTTKAIGGELFSDNDYYYHVFKGAGTFEALQSLSADILVVAGGGGSMGAGGGAGAGGLLGFASQSLTAQKYPVLVGAGGAQGASVAGSGTATNGGNSKFGSLTTALGGAYGGGFTGAAYISAGSGGGSGGGAPFNPAGSATGGTAGQGNSGSTGYQGTGGGDPRSGGGGGGAGGAAPNGSANTGGNGGIGATNGSTVGGSAGPYNFINAMAAATGTGQLSSGNYYFAGGGGGEGKNYRGAAGLGGGGQGGTSEPAQYPDPGVINTGGGAGSGPNTFSSYGGAKGGSGIVIVRYAK